MGFVTNCQSILVDTIQELYEITCETVISRYTSGKETVVYFSKSYFPRPIKRTTFQKTEKLNSLQVTVSAPLDDTLRKYLANSPSAPVFIKIIACFLSAPNTDFIVLFNGPVIDVTFQDQTVHAVCESTKILRNKIPRLVYQSSCNHDLFDEKCALSSTSYALSGILTSVSGSEISADAWSSKPDNYFTGGYVKFLSDLRMVTNHTGNTLALQAPFDTRVTPGVTIIAYPGCDKSPNTCKLKFSNFDNFLGFPYIPNSNPTIWGLK